MFRKQNHMGVSFWPINTPWAKIAMRRAEWFSPIADRMVCSLCKTAHPCNFAFIRHFICENVCTFCKVLRFLAKTEKTQRRNLSPRTSAPAQIKWADRHYSDVTKHLKTKQRSVSSTEIEKTKQTKSHGYESHWWPYYDDVIKWEHLLAICAGNSPGTQRPVTRSFDVIFYLHLHKRLSEQS